MKHLFLILTTAMFACNDDIKFGDPIEEANAAQEAAATIYTPAWDHKKLTRHHNELVRIRFKAGNTRAGYLDPRTSDSTVEIFGSTDEGIYQLNEVEWIENRNFEVIYP